MKYLKQFENIKKKLNLGDYVMCLEIPYDRFDKVRFEEVYEFEKNNIGKYVKSVNTNGKFSYIIKYEDVPEKFKNKFFLKEKDIDGYCRVMARNEIIAFSKNKEDLITILASNKFNI